jgi:uncharacterized RDD family membrane protein YckC
VAIRQLNYCPHCGMPLFKRGGDPVYFCQNCGHGLAGLGAPAIDSQSSGALGGASASSSGASGSSSGASGSSSGASGSAGAVRPPLVLVADLPHHAGLARRVAAAGLDLFLAGLAAVVASSIAVQAAIIVQGRHTADPRAVAWIAGIAVLTAYQPLSWARYGATPGMQLFGIRVTRPDGSRLGPARAIGREVAMVASALPLGLGFAWAVWDARGQAWHDRIAGTVVIAAAAPLRARRFPPTTAS